MDDNDVEQEKKVQFYGAAVNAWINSALERDKSMLALSAGGIGLIVTLVPQAVKGSVISLVLCILALLGFLVCLAAVLFGFNRSTAHIEKVIDKMGERFPPDPVLTKIDNAARVGFGFGVLMTATAGVTWAIQSYSDSVKECAAMSSKEVQKVVETVDLRRSLNGIGQLQPAAPASGTTSSTPAQVPAPASSPAQGTTSSGGTSSASK